MKETIERLRAVRKTILEVEDQLAEVDLRYAAEDIQTSIDELEKVRALTGEQVGEAIRKAIAPHMRKTCTCGWVDVTHGLKGYAEHVRGLTDPACPIHGANRCTCGKVDVVSARKGYTTSSPGRTDPQCPIHGKPEAENADV